MNKAKSENCKIINEGFGKIYFDKYLESKNL